MMQSLRGCLVRRLNHILSICFMALGLSLFLFWGTNASAWIDNDAITQVALSRWDQWEDVEPVGLAQIFSTGPFVVNGVRIDSVPALLGLIEVRPEKLELKVSGGALAVVSEFSQLPNKGLDRMEGSDNGPFPWASGFEHSEEARRKTYLTAFDWRLPFLTFHWPKVRQTVGSALERAKLYFDLAVALKKKKQWYWSYAFLGLSLHYVEGLNEPYLCHQFGSVTVAPWGRWLMGDREGFFRGVHKEVGNFRIAFEYYAQYLLKKSVPGLGNTTVNTSLASGAGTAANANRITDFDDYLLLPVPTEALKNYLNQPEDLAIESVLAATGKAAGMLAPLLIGSQQGLMKKDMDDPSFSLAEGFYQANGSPKLDFASYEETKVKEKIRHLDIFHKTLSEIYSNTGLTIRHVFDLYRKL